MKDQITIIRDRFLRAAEIRHEFNSRQPPNRLIGVKAAADAYERCAGELTALLAGLEPPTTIMRWFEAEALQETQAREGGV